MATIFSSVISSFFTQIRGGGAGPLGSFPRSTTVKSVEREDIVKDLSFSNITFHITI